MNTALAFRTLPRRLQALLKRGSRRPSPVKIPALLEALERECEGLNAFGADSDSEFTALASGVGTLTERMSQVRQQSAGLSLTLEDRDEDRALASAYAIYKNSVDLVHSSVGIAISEQQQMQGVEERLRQVSAVRETFKRNSLIFRMIAMGIRMEAARLDADHQGTFLNVSAAIVDIEHQMFETTEAAFERIAQVTSETAAERRQLGDLQATLHDRAQHSIRTIQEELTKVQKALAPCAEESRAIEALFAQAQPYTARLITALQHQDIVRQKLEHVALGFVDLARHARDGAALDLGYVHYAAQIQRTQLRLARDTIDRAATEITTGMTDLLRVTATLLSRFEAMHVAAGAAFNDCRVATLFKEEIHNLSQIAQQSEQTNQKISKLVDRIEEIVQVFARDIAKHEFDVKLVALNAQIAAARLSSADALNRLAEESIHVSSGNGLLTKALAGDLAETLNQLGQIKREAGEFLNVVTNEKTALQVGAVNVAEKLHRLTQRTQHTATEMNRDFAVLHQQIDRLLAEVRFPAQIATCCGPAEQVCEDLMAQTKPMADAGLSLQARAKLQEHQSRYTMSTERASHTEVLARTATPAATSSTATAVEAATAETKPDEFGAGIELF
jgi:hypothetical protein